MTTGTPGNRVRLLETGDSFFPVLEQAIDAATEEVHVETYIFADDPTGRRLAAALARAARRGATVRVLVDGFGSLNLVPPLRAVLEPAGVHIGVYRPDPGRGRLHRRRLRRMHRKLAVIDGRIAFCGGINFCDDRDGQTGIAPRYDFAVQIDGPLVGEFHRVVRNLWRVVDLVARRGAGAPRVLRRPSPGPHADGYSASLITRDNLVHRRSIEDAYLQAIDAAASDVIIANAYFLPGRRFRRALRAAVARGVRIRLLLQGRPDHLLAYHATRALYESLAAAGMEIYEYDAANLHAKVAVVDGGWATVGSSNIDPFSLWLSREANAVVHDPAVIRGLRASLERAIAHHARPIGREPGTRIAWIDRVTAWGAYRIARLLVGITGAAVRDEL